MIVRHVQPDQSVSRMRPAGTVEVLIEAEERWLRQTVQDRDQILVIRAPGRHVHTHEAEADAPITQQEPLAGGQVFVEHQHGIP